MDPHWIQILNAANNHDVVCQITHHLKLKLLPTEQRFLNQDLRDRTGIKTRLANGDELLGVVSDPSTTTAEREGRSNDAWIAADRGTNRFSFFQIGGDS